MIISGGGSVVFDEHVPSATSAEPRFTGARWYGFLGLPNSLGIQVRVDNHTYVALNLWVDIEHSADGLHWCRLASLITNQSVPTKGGTFRGSCLNRLALARFKLWFDVEQPAHVRIHAVSRDHLVEGIRPPDRLTEPAKDTWEPSVEEDFRSLTKIYKG